MKTDIMKKAVRTLSALLASVVVFAGCATKDSMELSVDGDVWVESMQLSGFDAVIDNVSRTITVSVSETFDASLMEITSIKLSEGASSSLNVGDRLNMNAPQIIRVINGNVFLDYTLKVVHDYADVLAFRLNDQYTGVINTTARTIVVRVPETVNVAAMTVSMTLSAGAVCNVAQGAVMDFTQPLTLTVSYNTAQKSYTVSVLPLGKPEALFVGLASTVDGLKPEEKEAAMWMLSNVDAAQYASFEDIALSNVDLSECEVIWWHYHIDGGIDNMSKFDNASPEANAAIAKLKEYYNGGGHFLLSRFATFYAVKLDAVKDDANPNNCWGGNETSPETVGGPWDFRIGGNENHALYQGLTMNTGETDKVYMFDAGYKVTNSTCQWHIGSDWGGYADLDTWRNNTGGVDLAHGGDGAVVIWEYPATGSKGNILCIGTGTYDWYAHEYDASSDQYHGNVAKLTMNAINYINR